MTGSKHIHTVPGAKHSVMVNPSRMLRQYMLFCLLLVIITLGIYWQAGNMILLI